MSNHQNKCENLLSDMGESYNWDDFRAHTFPADVFTHDSVIIGYGRSTIYQYWIVKQSWGTDFGE